MKTIAIIIFAFYSISIFCNNDVVLYRDMYYKSATNKKEAEVFLETMKKHSTTDALSTAYKGMAYMIMANHAFNPYNKLSYFNKGKNLLESAIKYDANNIELRFLRFCIQTNAPAFLFYDSEIASDKIHIMINWRLLKDEDLKLKIKEYMLSSKRLTTQEKNIFK